jgi:hypothetical protein
MIASLFDIWPVASLSRPRDFRAIGADRNTRRSGSAQGLA